MAHEDDPPGAKRQSMVLKSVNSFLVRTNLVSADFPKMPIIICAFYSSFCSLFLFELANFLYRHRIQIF